MKHIGTVALVISAILFAYGATLLADRVREHTQVIARIADAQGILLQSMPPRLK